MRLCGNSTDLNLHDVAAVEALRTALATERAVRAELPVAVAEGGAVCTRLVLQRASDTIGATPAPHE